MHADANHAPTPPLLEIDDATVLRGGQPVLDRFSLRVDAGRHTAILGANGSGKSTLVQLIARRPITPVIDRRSRVRPARTRRVKKVHGCTFLTISKG